MKKNNEFFSDVLPRNQKTTKKVAFKGDVISLTKTEAEILHYLNDLGLTISQIASRRGCSKQYIRKVRLNLEKKGWLRKVAPPPLAPREDSATPATKRGLIRVHAQKFRVGLVKPVSKGYKKRVNTVLRVDGNNVQCFKDCICIQARGKSFFGVSEDEALERSLEYWYRFFNILENDMGTLIIKDRKQNITQTFCEYATENSELAKECEKRGRRIKIFALDGKFRFSTDWSKTHEHETHHPVMSKADSEQGNRFINDVLDHPEAPTFTQLVKVTMVIAEQQKEASAGLLSVINLMRPQECEVKNEKADYFG